MKNKLALCALTALLSVSIQAMQPEPATTTSFKDSFVSGITTVKDKVSTGIKTGFNKTRDFASNAGTFVKDRLPTRSDFRSWHNNALNHMQTGWQRGKVWATNNPLEATIGAVVVTAIVGGIIHLAYRYAKNKRTTARI